MVMVVVMVVAVPGMVVLEFKPCSACSPLLALSMAMPMVMMVRHSVSITNVVPGGVANRGVSGIIRVSCACTFYSKPLVLDPTMHQDCPQKRLPSSKSRYRAPENGESVKNSTDNLKAWRQKALCFPSP